MKKLVALVAIIAISSLAIAHEFWLQPKKFRYKVGEDVSIDFLVGENFNGEQWDLMKNKVEIAQVVSAYGKKDLKASVKPTKGNNLTYKLANEGTHLFSMVSSAADITLDAEKFNAYLEDDGLDNIIALRKKNNQMNKSPHEMYTRYAKLMVQSGSKTDDEVFKRKLGLKVEIIPLQNPYTLKTGDYLECEVQYEGKPLPHQLVKVWSYLGNRAFLQPVYTENDGRLKFPISNTGPWMVSFVKMIESAKPGVDYESMWASLVFGIE
jgi:uncharacterized GH25 family protein